MAPDQPDPGAELSDLEPGDSSGCSESEGRPRQPGAAGTSLLRSRYRPMEPRSKAQLPRSRRSGSSMAQKGFVADNVTDLAPYGLDKPDATIELTLVCEPEFPARPARRQEGAGPPRPCLCPPGRSGRRGFRQRPVPGRDSPRQHRLSQSARHRHRSCRCFRDRDRWRSRPRSGSSVRARPGYSSRRKPKRPIATSSSRFSTSSTACRPASFWIPRG